MGIAWTTVGNIIQRTVRRRGMPLNRRKLYRIGLDDLLWALRTSARRGIGCRGMDGV
jgi:hypothetical protein